MPSFQTRQNMSFSARQIYDLVADVERYPEFLPMCTNLDVRRRWQEGDAEIIEARMDVGYKQISESFNSRVRLLPDELKIDVDYMEGPFRYLQNRWQFVPISDSECEVDFFIDYAFKSRLLGMVVGSVFDAAFRKFVVAFEERAKHVYGAGESRDSPVS